MIWFHQFVDRWEKLRMFNNQRYENSMNICTSLHINLNNLLWYLSILSLVCQTDMTLTDAKPWWRVNHQPWGSTRNNYMHCIDCAWFHCSSKEQTITQIFTIKLPIFSQMHQDPSCTFGCKKWGMTLFHSLFYNWWCGAWAATDVWLKLQTVYFVTNSFITPSTKCLHQQIAKQIIGRTD